MVHFAGVALSGVGVARGAFHKGYLQNWYSSKYVVSLERTLVFSALTLIPHL